MAYATLVAISGWLALPIGSWFARERGRGVTHTASRVASHRADAASGSARANLRIEVGTGVWLLLALVCLFQAVPMPLAWLEQLAPSQADVWARALRPFGLPAPELGTLSLAPHRTVVEGLKMASYGVIFYIAARLGRRGMARIAALAFGCALAVALVAACHRALGAERLFGLYLPSDTSAVAPLLNPNNRAGYYNLGFFCGLGLLFRAGASPRGAFVGIGLVLLVAEILLCQSRGGTLCLVLGMLAVPLLRPALHADPPSTGSRGELSRAWQVGIVGAIATGAAAMAIVSRPKGGLGYEESLEKLDLFARAGQLVSDHYLTGVGRGAFGSAFARHQPGAGSRVYEHAENLLLQWAAEWGVPVAAAALGAIVWSLWPALARRSLASPVRRCALIGAGALLAQNMVDLGLEITAVAALLVYVLGGLLGASLSNASPADPSPRLLAFASVLTTLCIGLVLVVGRDSPARERERMHARLGQTQGAPAADFFGALRAAVLEYPADPYFPLLGAAAALASSTDALPWAARAIECAPGSAPAQLVLARALLARRAPTQASDALRRAIELDPGAAHAAVRIGLDQHLSAELLARAVPEGPTGAAPLQMLADYSEAGSGERMHWLEQALARDPGSAAVHYRMALELQRDVALGDGGRICRQRRDDCIRRALAHVERAAAPPSPQTSLLRAQLIEQSQGSRVAEERLVGDCAPFPGDEDCARALLSLALRNQSERLPSAMRALIASGCATRERCAATHLTLGQQFAGLGQWRNAQNHFRQATQEWPTVEGWRALAQASTELGQSARAEDALRRAALLDVEKKGAQ